jgi:hypothetical protein
MHIELSQMPQWIHTLTSIRFAVTSLAEPPSRARAWSKRCARISSPPSSIWDILFSDSLENSDYGENAHCNSPINPSQ